ncbi:MAG: 30S ribosome-binding factor RbfA [Verrucomicrobia bacterium]|nr:30S ribosome-binding factor RbfA [Verrucomicrobiota bacterium]
MSKRIAKVKELMKRELSELIQRDFSFPGVLVTINDVDMTPDFKHAHVFVGIIGDSGQKRRVVSELNAKHGAIQNKISRRVILKYTPVISFRSDDSIERGVKVVALMDQLEELCPPAVEVEGDDSTASIGPEK